LREFSPLTYDFSGTYVLLGAAFSRIKGAWMFLDWVCGVLF